MVKIYSYFIILDANVYGTVFLISNFTCSLPMYRKAIEFLYINPVSCNLVIINY